MTNKEKSAIDQILQLDKKRKKTSRFIPTGEYSKIKEEMDNIATANNLILKFPNGELEITKLLYKDIV